MTSGGSFLQLPASSLLIFCYHEATLAEIHLIWECFIIITEIVMGYSYSLVFCFSQIFYSVLPRACERISSGILLDSSSLNQDAFNPSLSSFTRQTSPYPQTGAFCSGGRSRAQALHAHQPSQHYPQVPFQQCRVPAALSGPHRSPAGAEVLQKAGSARSFAAGRHQPEGPQLPGNHPATGRCHNYNSATLLM